MNTNEEDKLLLKEPIPKLADRMILSFGFFIRVHWCPFAVKIS
jgi:hypothetical protein